MEDDEVEYEEDRLEVAWARMRNSGSVFSAFAITPSGKTTAVIALTTGSRMVITQTQPRLKLTRRGKPSRIKTGTPNNAKILQSEAF